MRVCDEMCIGLLIDSFIGCGLCVCCDGETIGYYKDASHRETKCERVHWTGWRKLDEVWVFVIRSCVCINADIKVQLLVALRDCCLFPL